MKIDKMGGNVVRIVQRRNADRILIVKTKLKGLIARRKLRLEGNIKVKVKEIL
jgi:hypothetical protein